MVWSRWVGVGLVWSRWVDVGLISWEGESLDRIVLDVLHEVLLRCFLVHFIILGLGDGGRVADCRFFAVVDYELDVMILFGSTMGFVIWRSVCGFRLQALVCMIEVRV